MNMLHENAGKIFGMFGAGAGAGFLFLFQSMIRDTWNTVLARWRTARPTSTVAPPFLNGGSTADGKLGADLSHELITMMRQQYEDYKMEDGKRWQIVRDLADTLKSQAVSIAGLNEKAGQTQTILGILAGQRPQ